MNGMHELRSLVRASLRTERGTIGCVAVPMPRTARKARPSRRTIERPQHAPTRRARPRACPAARRSSAVSRCRRKFLRFFPQGFYDENYLAWERDYKWDAHRQWTRLLDRTTFRSLLRDGAFAEIAARAVKIESRTNLIFSFEKMALRDAVRPPGGARAFAQGLYEFVHGTGTMAGKVERWCEVVASLPRKQTRVLTWPVVTVFGFIAQPDAHMFLKPNVTRVAATEYGFDLQYESRPSWRAMRARWNSPPPCGATCATCGHAT
jgi:hypothetical protein